MHEDGQKLFDALRNSAPYYLFFRSMRSVLLLLATCFFIQGTAQSNFRRGFLLTNSQDTVRGLLRFADDVAVSTSCFYKPNNKGPISEYPPGTISGFRYDHDKFFTSRSVGKSADVFLEVLVKGNISLYKFHDIYFIEKADSAFFELSDDIEEVQIEGEQVRARTRNYTRMLMLMVGDCVEASRIAPSTLLKEKSLIRLVSIYNTCRGSSNYYYRNQVK